MNGNVDWGYLLLAAVVILPVLGLLLRFSGKLLSLAAPDVVPLCLWRSGWLERLF